MENGPNFVSRTERTQQHAIPASGWNSSYHGYDVIRPNIADQNFLPVIEIQGHVDTQGSTRKILQSQKVVETRRKASPHRARFSAEE